MDPHRRQFGSGEVEERAALDEVWLDGEGVGETDIDSEASSEQLACESSFTAEALALEDWPS